MSSWRLVPNFVILCVGQFVENSDISGFALNSHWYVIFKRYISCFPHLFTTFLHAGKCYELASTEYQVINGQLTIIGGWEDYSRLILFQSLRHVTIVHQTKNLIISEVVARNLIHALKQLPELKTITLKAIHGAFLGNPEFILNLPGKITGVDVTHAGDFGALEPRFDQLLHCNPPWRAGMELFLDKTPNLRRLIFDGMPESFHFLTNMHQLTSFTWRITGHVKVKEWNAFVAAVTPSLRSLSVDSMYFHRILSSQHALPISSVTEVWFDSSNDSENSIITNVKRVIPRLRHLHLFLHCIQSFERIEETVENMPTRCVQAQLDTYSTYFVNLSNDTVCMTYHKGDVKVSRSGYHRYAFGLL